MMATLRFVVGAGSTLASVHEAARADSVTEFLLWEFIALFFFAMAVDAAEESST